MGTAGVSVGKLRERAGRVLQYVAVRDVHLHSLKSRGASPQVDGPFNVSADIRVRGIQLGEFGQVQSWAWYEVSATAQSEEEESGREAWTVTMELVAEYWAHDAEEFPQFTQDELTAFSLVIGLMTIHPYARETVQSLTGRMGYPPFTLEMLDPISANEDSHVVQIETTEMEV